ncbi:Ubiquitin-protein ligase E3A, partial [Bonamia ostreae]
NKSKKIFFGLNLFGIREIFDKIEKLDFNDVKNSLTERFRQIIKNLLSNAIKCQTKNSSKVKRILILILESPSFEKLCGEQESHLIINDFFDFFASLKKSSLEEFAKNFSVYKQKSFERIVHSVQQHISSTCIQMNHNFDIQKINSPIQILNLLHRSKPENPSIFKNDSLCESLKFHLNPDNIDLQSKIKTSIRPHFKWILNTDTKQFLLATENTKEQNEAILSDLSEFSLQRQYNFDSNFNNIVLNENDNSNGNAVGGNGDGNNYGIDREREDNQRVPLRLINDYESMNYEVPIAFPPTERELLEPEEFEVSANSSIVANSVSSVANSIENNGINEIDFDIEERNQFDFDSHLSRYCYFVVCREHVIADTLRFLENYKTKQLKKSLKIVFCKEIGVDEGGLINEFFQVCNI